MAITVEQANEALKRVIDPNTGKDLLSTRSARNVRVDGGDVSLDVELGYPAASQVDGIRRAVIDALKAAGAANVSANVTMKIVAHTVQRGLKVMPNVKNIIAVASGKGGVGKSTVAANLALALAAEGARVGVLDADIYGPSQPTMLGISGRPESIDGRTMEPMENHGLQMSSIGLLGPAGIAQLDVEGDVAAFDAQVLHLLGADEVLARVGVGDGLQRFQQLGFGDGSGHRPGGVSGWGQ